MIPKIIHFIFGLRPDFGGRPFSFIHYLAVYTAWKVNRPEKILFHYAFEPDGDWWEKAKAYLTLNKIEAPTEIFGIPVVHYAHRADIVRLEMLKTYGGIYLDLDVLCINPFEPLLSNDFIMGLMRNRGLCNAVILSKPNAPFLSMWLAKYKDFNGSSYDMHSVVLPFLLAMQNPSLCHIVHEDLFFYPTHKDPVHRYLFGLSMPIYLRIGSVAQNVIKLGMHVVGIRKMKLKEFVFHAIHGRKWHYRKLCQSYCIHLWETDWGNRYLASLNPEYVLVGTSNLCLLLQKVLGKDELLRLSAGVGAQNVLEDG
jgi:hypothetical protein